MELPLHQYRYIDWKTPEEMHFSSLEWKSEINFVKDEQKFLEHLLHTYCTGKLLPLINLHCSETIHQIKLSQKELKKLELKVNAHMQALRTFLEQAERIQSGRSYRQEHKAILNDFALFSSQFKRLKKGIFHTLTTFIKSQKQKNLTAGT
ncbi:hypothetical protein [Salinimicrobium oceani]|uniref:Uncharacterized protein n=1 Tax=Salinimicrobium oceani TaxID=2722702 RepID=A0ABX1CW74_9FLAO|nr:hypothetical protein [Salinimicrobium oceani]NJW52533.1 hypothetical protein [Salinimicrobium oceani]